ncbi:MAG: carboxypeptidase-like regulatory domain-containing protein [Bacteroidota bacterium]
MLRFHLSKSIILCFIVFGLAKSVFPQIQTIEVEPRNGSENLEQILSSLQDEYGLSFFYQDSWMPQFPINLPRDTLALPQFLSQLLEPLNMGFISYDEHLIVVAPSTLLDQELVYRAPVEANTGRRINRGVVLGDSLNPVQGRYVRIEGRVIDVTNGNPLARAQMEVLDKEIGTFTDERGRYELQVPVGEHQIAIRSTGFAEFVQDVVVYSDDQWEIEMDLTAYRLDEVLLEAEATDQNISSTNVGISQLSMNQMRRMPAFMGEVDVVKSIMMLPGVSSVGEGSSGFNVRGGTIDQNLVLQDESPIFNTSHVLGFFSIFNPDLVEQVTLYKGHIPAQFGGRIASVLDVQLKEGDFRNFSGKGGIGAVASRVSFEGPIKKDQTSFVVGLRGSYADWVLRLAANPDVKESSALYYDANARITHRFNLNSILSLSAYSSRDHFQFSSDYGFSWGTQLIDVNWRNVLSEKLSSTTHAAYGDYSSKFFDPEGQDAFDLEGGINYYKVKQNFLFAPSASHTLNFGAELNSYDSKAETFSARGNDSGVAPQKVGKEQGREWVAYLNDEIALGDFISLSLGIRYSFYQQVGADSVFVYPNDQPRNELDIQDTIFYGSGSVIQEYSGWEPRAALRITLDEKSSIKMSYNRMRQYIHLISNTAAATPVDLWQVSTPYVPPQIANNYSLGFFRNFRSNAWETSLEFYYKDIEQLNEYKDIPDLLLNPHLETELLVGEGQIYGGELSIRKTKGIWTGWLSYAYARSLRRVRGDSPEENINEGDWFPSNFDKPHQINMVNTWQLNKQHSLSANFTFSTGRPITAPIADYTIGTHVIPHYSERNQLRIPDYHRLDFSYTIEPNIIRRKRLKNTLTFSVYNVYFRKNAFSIFFQRREDRFIPNAFRLAVLGTAFPSITYNFRF